MVRLFSTASLWALVVTAASISTGAEQTGNSRAHSFLQVGRTYRFITDEPDFRAEVLEIRTENWILVKGICRRGGCVPPETAGPTWINLGKVNMIQGLPVDAQAGPTSETRRLPFIVGRWYRFARFSTDEDDVLAKVVHVPHDSWVQVDRTRPRPKGPPPKPAASLWLNVDVLGSITEVPERAK